MNLHRYDPLIVLAVVLLGTAPLQGAEITYPDSWGPHGLSVQDQSGSGLSLSFSLTGWDLGDIELDGRTQKTVQVAGMMLPNETGAPNVPGTSRFFAVPNGASVSWRIVASRTERLSGIDLAPAPRIPLETESGPLDYPRDESIYSRDAFYPESPVLLSPVSEIRGVAAAVIGVTPFQYNPVSGELVVWRDLEIELTFHGGDGTFGDDRLRSRWWDPILRDLLVNSSLLEPVDPAGDAALRTQGYDYVIVCQDDPIFLAWADSLRRWRSEEGIRTGVVTTTEIGGNTTAAIDAYVNDAYVNWGTSAVLLMGDYGTGTSGIISPIYNSYCISDNLYADVTGDHLPDIAFARLTARNETELSEMIGKMLDYERNPPTDPGFYSNPIMAGGWQTERWFILCEEVLYGYFANEHGKTPVREYAIYSGTPGTVWSTATNTATVVAYFGPAGLGYIPSTPAHLTDWGGNASRINADINAGAFILQHRDHGSTSGWGEPAYSISSLSGLSNDEPTFVFSINCLTGQYNITGDCFAEAFHRHAQRALGIIAATETSYSFVNDTYVWGMYDFMWPDFDPGYGTTGPVNARPAFANASGKYYLAGSSWPYNTSNKEVTYYLFHHHGDAFMTVYTEMPQTLTVTHDPVLIAGADFFTVTADVGSTIGLSADGEFLAVAAGTGSPVNISIPPQDPGTDFVVTVTKQDFYRYRQALPVTPPTGPYVVYHSNVVDDSDGDGDAMLDEGETVDLWVTLQNLGTEDATRVSARLTSDDSTITVVEGWRGYPMIPAGGTGTSANPFVVTVAGDAPDGHVASFTMSVNDGITVRDSYFALSIQAPSLVVTHLEVNDLEGNGDGNANAGETILLAVEIANEGHSDAAPLSATLTTADPDVVVLDGAGDCGAIPEAGHGIVTTFEVQILPSCPEPSNVSLQLDVSCGNGFAAAIGFELPVGGWLDDMETARGWIVGAPDDGATTGIWERVDPIGTSYNGHPIQMEDDHTAAPGVNCFVTGNGSIGGSAGENDVDGGKTTLLTPVFELEGALSATVTYWRWYTNSWGGSPDSDWWNVDVTNDGVNWVSLEHTMQTAASWTQHTFDLTDFITLTDQVQIRFVAEDAGGGSLVEAGVDDFLLTAVRPIVTGVEEDVTLAAPVELALGTNYPNPFDPETKIRFALPHAGRVELAVYDISGRRVATLVSDELEAGRHEVGWQGRDADGRRVASGVYFSRLEADGRVLTRKMLLLR